MWKSTFLEEIREQGRLAARFEERRESIIKVMKARFPGQPMDDIAQRINAESAAAKLDEWISLAATAANLDDVRSKLVP